MTVQVKMEDADLQSAAPVSVNLIDFTDLTPVVSMQMSRDVSASSSEGGRSSRSPLNLIKSIFRNLKCINLNIQIHRKYTKYTENLLSSSYPQSISPNLSLHPAGSFLQLL